AARRLTGLSEDALNAARLDDLLVPWAMPRAGDLWVRFLEKLGEAVWNAATPLYEIPQRDGPARLVQCATHDLGDLRAVIMKDVTLHRFASLGLEGIID